MSVVQILESARADILERLMERIRGELAEGFEEEEEEKRLLDEIPEFLDGLAGRLREGVARPPVATLTASARDHGVQRQRIGFDIGTILREYRFVYTVILEVVAERGEEITRTEHEALVQELFEASVLSSDAYVRARDVELQQQSARYYSFVAHELRNPLQTALLATQTLKDAERPPPRLVARLEQSLSQLRHLIDESITAAVLRAERETRPQRFPVVELVDFTLRDAQIEADGRGIDLRADVPPRLYVTWDPRLMRSALGNLVRNAIKFTRPGTEILVRAREEDERVLVEVEDRCGGPSGNRSQKGFGLGLEIAERAAAAHGGGLELRDLPGEGCIYTLAAPREKQAQNL